MPFITISCFYNLAKTFSTILNISGDSGHTCLVPDLKECLLTFAIEDSVSFMFFIYDIYYIKYTYILIYTYITEGFIMKGHCTFVKRFFGSIEMII